MAGAPAQAARRGRLIALAIISAGVLALWFAWDRSARFPSTDDAAIETDVVHIAAPVGGRIVRVAVAENAHVAKGAVLFEIDPVPYRLTVAQAQANVELARASLATRQRSLVGEKSAAAMAAEQTRRARQNHDLAVRNVERLRPLAAKGYVSAQQFDQAVVAQHDAAVSLAQAREQQRSTAQTVGEDAGAVAALHASEAALANAQYALAQTVVRAPFDGYVAGLDVLAGETIAPNQSLFTLIDAREWFAVANFRETALDEIHVGDCATVYSMLGRDQPLHGRVVGIGAGVAHGDNVNLPRGLPFVQRSVNWVRVAQRFPVRVRLEEPPARLVRIGASAMVEIRHGHACR
ncbi:MAG: multidrug transporter subunit MdtN [Perlucidibaca sp.]